MKKKILVVENDPILTQSLINHCHHKNYDVVTSTTVQKALTYTQESYFDLVIVDRGLDDGDGLTVVEYITDTFPCTRVLICSQTGDVQNRIKGLSAGADNYVPKPFSFTELSLKIEKLLAVEKLSLEESLHAGKITVYPDSGKVVIDTKVCYLRKREHQILTCLVKHRKRVVSRDTLISYIWGNSEHIPAYSTLDVYIRRIRIAIGKEYGKLIKTVRGFGYMITE
jgi:two-component system, OmpR family, response regulator